MYSIEKTGYGFKLTLAGHMNAEEIGNWIKLCKEELDTQVPGFGVLLDMRKLQPLPEDALQDLRKAQWLFKTTGMVRSAIIVNSVVLKTHLTHMAKQLGIYNWERYIDASTDSDWEKTTMDWIERAVDPDTAVAVY